MIFERSSCDYLNDYHISKRWSKVVLREKRRRQMHVEAEAEVATVSSETPELLGPGKSEGQIFSRGK